MTTESRGWGPGHILASPEKADLVRAIDAARGNADAIHIKHYLAAVQEIVATDGLSDDAMKSLLKAYETGNWFADGTRLVRLSGEQRGAFRAVAASAIVARGGTFPIDKREVWVADAKGLRKEMR